MQKQHSGQLAQRLLQVVRMFPTQQASDHPPIPRRPKRMSAAAINTAPIPAAGATATAGSATGVGAAHGAQATGLPAIFQAMLATLAQAEDAATAGAASAQVAAGGTLA